MASIINASTTAGIVQTADTSGVLQLQANGTTVATVSSSGFTANTYTPSTSLITSGTAQASTSGSAITFTGIPSWVKRITVMFAGVSTSGNEFFVIQIGSGGIAQTTGYNSQVGTLYNTSALVQTSTSGFYITNKQGSADVYGGSVVLTLLSGNTWVINGSVGETGGATSRTNTSSGNVSLSGALNILTITDNTPGTFTAGSINILYE